MKIEAGKFYKTRDGRKIGPMQSVPNCCFYKWEAVMGGIRHSYSADGRFHDHRESSFDLMAEWTDEPRPWGELTDAEKGALLLAKHEGKEIQTKYPRDVNWLTDQYVKFNSPDLCYRVKPEPVVETVTLYGVKDVHYGYHFSTKAGKELRLTFTTTDGEPATGTFISEDGSAVIKMERL